MHCLINCLAYIDLNPVRAGLVGRPEDYRWCSLAYHMQTSNKDNFLSLDFGLTAFGDWDATTRLQYYRRYVYTHGAQPATKGVLLAPKLVDTEAQKGFAFTRADRLLYRTRYFTDSGVIGTKAFILHCAQLFAHHFASRHASQPRLLPNGQPETRVMLVPASAATISDTWNTSGMRGTGSHDFTVNDVFVPFEDSPNMAEPPPGRLLLGLNPEELFF